MFLAISLDCLSFVLEFLFIKVLFKLKDYTAFFQIF